MEYNNYVRDVVALFTSIKANIVPDTRTGEIFQMTLASIKDALTIGDKYWKLNDQHIAAIPLKDKALKCNEEDRLATR